MDRGSESTFRAIPDRSVGDMMRGLGSVMDWIGLDWNAKREQVGDWDLPRSSVTLSRFTILQHNFTHTHTVYYQNTIQLMSKTNERYNNNPYSYPNLSHKSTLYCADDYHTTKLQTCKSWTIRVFLCLISRYNPDEGRITLTVPDCVKMSGLSHNKVRDGIAELIQIDVIKRARGIGEYYVSPSYVRTIGISV